MRKTDKTNLPPRRRACGNCGRLGHLARTCTAQPRAHARIGVEVEGWWFDLPGIRRTAANWHMSGSSDGSLKEDSTGETSSYEFRTRPGSLGEAISQVVAIYPDKCDRSAGMHVHMSFRSPADTMLLSSPTFLTYFRERWEAWGTRMGVHESSDFWLRLRRGNQFCAVNSDDDVRTPMQVSRYRQLNFRSWINSRKTVEMRMLPLFRDARLAVSALEEWVSIVEDYIAVHANGVLAARDTEVVLDPAVDFPPTVERELGFDLGGDYSYTHAIDVAPLVSIWGRSFDMIEPYLDEREREFTVQRTAPLEMTDEVQLQPVLPVAPGHTRYTSSRAARNALRDLVVGAGVL